MEFECIYIKYLQKKLNEVKAHLGDRLRKVIQNLLQRAEAAFGPWLHGAHKVGADVVITIPSSPLDEPAVDRSLRALNQPKGHRPEHEHPTLTVDHRPEHRIVHFAVPRALRRNDHSHKGGEKKRADPSGKQGLRSHQPVQTVQVHHRIFFGG